MNACSFAPILTTYIRADDVLPEYPDTFRSDPTKPRNYYAHGPLSPSPAGSLT